MEDRYSNLNLNQGVIRKKNCLFINSQISSQLNQQFTQLKSEKTVITTFIPNMSMSFILRSKPEPRNLQSLPFS